MFGVPQFCWFSAVSALSQLRFLFGFSCFFLCDATAQAPKTPKHPPPTAQQSVHLVDIAELNQSLLFSHLTCNLHKILPKTQQSSSSRREKIVSGAENRRKVGGNPWWGWKRWRGADQGSLQIRNHWQLRVNLFYSFMCILRSHTLTLAHLHWKRISCISLTERKICVANSPWSSSFGLFTFTFYLLKRHEETYELCSLWDMNLLIYVHYVFVYTFQGIWFRNILWNAQLFKIFSFSSFALEVSTVHIFW